MDKRGELQSTLSRNNYGFGQLVFSPDRRLLAVKPNVAGRVDFYDLEKKKWEGILSTQGSISEIAFSSDGKLLATAGYDDKSIRIWR